MTGDDLLMDLGLEQGLTRRTQVQPPIGVWRNYFNVEPRDLTEGEALDMLDLDNPEEGVTEHRIVEHDHNWTLEVGTSEPGAILWIRRVGDVYQYRVLRPGAPDHHHADWVLATFRNPIRRPGRRWLIV